MPDNTTTKPDLPRYRHYKGDFYWILREATEEATGTPVVVYMAEKDGRVWVRPTGEFFGTVHDELPGGIATRTRRFLPCAEPCK